jgi:hypothetical protein
MAQLALRRRALSGLGNTFAECYADPFCRTVQDVNCHTLFAGTQKCSQWRAYEPGATVIPLPAPATITPPVIDTNPASPTYGQATVDGRVIETPSQVRDLIDQQIAGADEETRRRLLETFGEQADANCLVLKQSCGNFMSPSADCTECVFDPTKPMFLLLAFAAAAVLIAKPWR